MAALRDTPARAGTGHDERLEQADTEIDNLRAAFAWSRENSDVELALALASSLQPLWFARGRIREGLTWFDAALTDLNAHPAEVAPAVRARALADKATLDALFGAPDSMEQAHEALAIAREVDDPALLARALTACGGIAVCDPELARPYFAEALELARASGERLSSSASWSGRHTGRPWRVIRSQRARSARKDATSPTRSATGSPPVDAAAGAWVRRR